MARVADNGRYGFPALRPSSVRAWYLADTDRDDLAYDTVGGYLLDGDNSSQTNLPYVIDSPTGKARAFRAGNGQGLWGPIPASLPEGDRLSALGDWTISILYRKMSSVHAGSVFSLVGEQGDGDPADNYLINCQVNTAGNPVLFWEWTDGTSQQTVTATNYSVPLYEWNVLTWRKSNTTLLNGLPVGGAIDNGGGGTFDLEFLVNGRVIQSGLVAASDPRYDASLLGLTNTDGGQNAIWAIGGLPTAGFAGINQVPQCDLDGCFFWNEALSDAELQEDARRWLALKGHTRAALRVTVEDQNGAELDLTDLDGVDFVTKADLTDELDQAVVTANVEVAREQEKKSLATLITNSRRNLSDPDDPTSFVLPFLDLGRSIELFSARVPLGIDPDGRDWFSIFRGNIDEIREGGESISLVCRDLGGVLLDTFIETERDYSDPATPFAVEGEMQFILDDNDSTAVSGSYDPVTLYTPVSPSWAVLGWRQRREPVMSALRTLAGQIGGDVRYRYDSNPEGPPSWRLTFSIPDRERLEANIVLAEEDVLEVSNLSRTLLGIRNVVRVVYPSSELTQPTTPTPPAGVSITPAWNSLDGEQNRLTSYVELEDTASISRIGRRLYMEVAEAGSSQIDTINEAFDMALGMLRDLSEEDLGKSISLALMPEIDLNDLVLIQPIRELTTVDQRLAVKRVSHTFDPSGAVSTVELRGKAAVGQKRWLRLDTRAGGGKPAVVEPSQALTDQVLGGLIAGVRNFLDRTNYFQGGKFFAVRNPNFQSFSNGLESPPDGWTMEPNPSWAANPGFGGTWGGLIQGGASGASAYVSDDSASGNWSVGLDWTDGALVSDFIPIDVQDFTPLGLEVVWKALSTAADAIVELLWYDEDRNPIEPYGAARANRSIHPAVRDPSYSTTKNARMTSNSDSDGVSQITLRPGVIETAQFAVDDIVDHTLDNAGTASGVLGYYQRRGQVVAVTTGGAGDPEYVIEAPTGTAVPPAGTTTVDGVMCWRPPYWYGDASSAGANVWHTSRQTGIEPPSNDARYLRVMLRNGTSTTDVRFDSVAVFRAGRELRLSTPVPTNQTFAINQWEHNRQQSPSPGPRVTGGAPSDFRAGLDYGDNFRTDSFLTGATTNTGPYFLAVEDGLLEIKSLFSIREPTAGTVRARLRVVRNALYGDLAANFSHQSGEVLLYGNYSDDTNQVGLPLSDTVVASLIDRVPVTAGDRISVEVYITNTNGTSVSPVPDAELNFTSFKLFSNF